MRALLALAYFATAVCAQCTGEPNTPRVTLARPTVAIKVILSSFSISIILSGHSMCIQGGAL